LARKIADLDEPQAESPHAVPQPPQPPQQTPPQPPPQLSQQQRPLREDWGDLLVRMLAAAPEDVAAKLINCLDKEVLTKALEGRADPYLKLALLLLRK